MLVTVPHVCDISAFQECELRGLDRKGEATGLEIGAFFPYSVFADFLTSVRKSARDCPVCE